MYTVQQKRSVVKAITFRATVLASDIIVIFLITRRINFTIGLVIMTNIMSTILYFFHERVWNKSQWGRAEIEKCEDSTHIFKKVENGVA